MKIGQTSVIVFSAKFVGSALGFLATLYFARELGAEVLGIYAVILSTVAWLQTGGKMGIAKATNKRISEGSDQSAYLTAGYMAIIGFAVVMSLVIVSIRPSVERYITDFTFYSTTSVVWFILTILFVKLTFIYVMEVLKGQRRVGLAALLKPTKTGVRSAFQIGLVVVGFSLVGMLVGYILGVALVVVIGIFLIRMRPTLPGTKHFRSLFDYAKFSWVGGLKSRALNDVDIVVLNILVTTGLVGVYSVAWSLSKFLDLFSSAIGETVFPELSNISTQEDIQKAVPVLEDSITFAGLITIPGMIGGTLLSDRLLMLYGEEFVQGTEVLGLLILSILCFSYYRQFLNALNGFDYPELAFRANLVFISSNVILNLILIWQFGWVGAAIASVVSVFLGGIVSYMYLLQIVSFQFPFGEVGRQIAAALLMGGIVLISQSAIEESIFDPHNAVIILLLVSLGAGVYVLTLFAISQKFRTTVSRNLSISVPYLNQ